jgi:molecular chaperone GrpE
LTLDLLEKTLAKFAVEAIAPETGEAFNPEQHEAMSMAPAGDVASGCVVQTLQKGYLLNGRVLRAAMVIVAQ